MNFKDVEKDLQKLIGMKLNSIRQGAEIERGCGRFLGPELSNSKTASSGKKCLSPAKKYKLYKSSINKSLHFAQRSLSSSPR